MSICLIKEIKKENYHLIYLDNSEIRLDSLHYLSAIEKNQLSEITTIKRQTEYLGVRLLKNHLFSKSELIQYTSERVPYLTINKHLNISISHSSSYIGFIVASYIIGVDIEEISEKVARVKDKFINESENISFDCSSCEILTRIWTMKEVIYKIARQPGLDYKNNIHIFERNGTYYGRVFLNNQWFQTEFDTFVENNTIFSYNIKELVQE